MGADRPSPDSPTRLAIRAQPFAQKSWILGFDGKCLSVVIAAPAVDNRANEELIRILAEALDLARSRIVIKGGHHSRVKLVEIDPNARALSRWLASRPSTATEVR